MIDSPVVRFDLAQNVFKKLFEDALGISVVWNTSDLPRVARPFGHLQNITEPDIVEISHEKRTICTNSDFEATLPNPPADNTRYTIRINGVPLRRITGVGDTVESLRDGFIVLINKDLEPVSGSILAIDQISVSETVPSGLTSISATTSIGLSVSPANTIRVANQLLARSRFTLSFQIITQNTKLSQQTASSALMSKAIMALDTNAGLDLLGDFGMTLKTLSAPVSLPALTPGGAKYESRTNLDLVATVTSIYNEPVDTIETVEGTLFVDDTEIPFTIPAP